MRWLDGISDLTDVSEEAPGTDDERGSMVRLSPLGHKELSMTERLD